MKVGLLARFRHDSGDNATAFSKAIFGTDFRDSPCRMRPLIIGNVGLSRVHLVGEAKPSEVKPKARSESKSFRIF